MILPFFNNLLHLDISGMQHVNDEFLLSASLHCKLLKSLCIKACKKVRKENPKKISYEKIGSVIFKQVTIKLISL